MRYTVCNTGPSTQKSVIKSVINLNHERYTRDYVTDVIHVTDIHEQGPSGVVRPASGLIIKWTRFAVGFIGRHALKLHDSLFTNEHYAVTVDAYSFESALYPAGLATR